MIKIHISHGVVHKVPKDLRSALASDLKSFTAWENLTSLARNEWICWVTFVKKEETRVEHIKRLVQELKRGKKRPCCWIGCIHRKDKTISPSIQAFLNKNTKK
jgi:lysozyme family protein